MGAPGGATDSFGQAITRPSAIPERKDCQVTNTRDQSDVGNECATVTSFYNTGLTSNNSSRAVCDELMTIMLSQLLSQNRST